MYRPESRLGIAAFPQAGMTICGEPVVLPGLSRRCPRVEGPRGGAALSFGQPGEAQALPISLYVLGPPVRTQVGFEIGDAPDGVKFHGLLHERPRLLAIPCSGSPDML